MSDNTSTDTEKLEARLQRIARELRATPDTMTMLLDAKGKLPWGWNRNSAREWEAANAGEFELMQEILLRDGGRLARWRCREKGVFHLFLENAAHELLFGVTVNRKDFMAHRRILQSIRRENRPADGDVDLRPEESHAPIVLAQVNGCEVSGEHIRVGARRERGDMRFADALTGDGHRRYLAIHRSFHEGFGASNVRFHDSNLRDLELYDHVTYLTHVVHVLGTRLVAAETQLAEMAAAAGESAVVAR